MSDMISISGGMEQQTSHSTVSYQTRFQAGGSAVPRFYFDVRDGPRFFADDEGRELDSLDAAEREAVTTAAQIGRDRLAKGDARAVTVEVRNEHGQWVLTVTVSVELHRVEPEPPRA
jgi:hypothetical protein